LGVKAIDYIKQRQMLWASRHEIPFEIRNGGGYANRIEHNLFEPLGDVARQAMSAGAGDELAEKIRAFHSSSAVAVNVFHYWSRQPDRKPLAEALGIRGTIGSVCFEAQHPICSADHPQAWRFRQPAHLDVELHLSGADVQAVAMEIKFTEPFSKHGGLSPTYLRVDGLWDRLPGCRSLAEKLTADTPVFHYLDAAQLLKHILSLRTCYGDSFRLVYLTHAVPTFDTHQHDQEVESFSGIVAADGIRFEHLTYQSLILKLAKSRPQHNRYLDWIAERYL
jgi:hypothetical protein